MNGIPIYHVTIYFMSAHHSFQIIVMYTPFSDMLSTFVYLFCIDIPLSNTIVLYTSRITSQAETYHVHSLKAVLLLTQALHSNHFSESYSSHHSPEWHLSLGGRRKPEGTLYSKKWGEWSLKWNLKWGWYWSMTSYLWQQSGDILCHEMLFLCDSKIIQDYIQI